MSVQTDPEGGYRAVCQLCAYRSKKFVKESQARAADSQHRTGVAHRVRMTRVR